MWTRRAVISSFRRTQAVRLCGSGRRFALTLATALVLGAPAAFAQTAFVDVNVIPMDSERVLSSYTVLVRDGVLAEVGPSGEVAIPTDADVIDGSGAYLMPGLADMHAHLYFEPDPGFLRVFLAAGTTTIRNLNALPAHLDWRNRLLSGELVGPSMYVSGPVIVGPPDMSFVWPLWVLETATVFAAGLLAWRRVRGAGPERVSRPRAMRRLAIGVAGLALLSAALIGSRIIPINAYTSRSFPHAYVPDTEVRARAEVQRQAERGYDLVKVYDFMTRDQYLGAIEEAARAGLYSIAHLDVGVTDALDAGLREIAHVDEFADFHLREEISPRDFTPVEFVYDRIPSTVEAVKAHDAAVVFNLTTDANTVKFLDAGPDYFQRPEYAVMRPAHVEGLRAGRVVAWQAQTAWRRDFMIPFLLDITHQLHEAGVLMVVGTDTAENTGSLPAHIHEELQLLVAAGLTPYEALRAATVNASRVVNRMGIDDAFGQIVEGQRADLILVDGNPLEDISATRRRIGAMARGTWYTQTELDAMVADFVSTF